MEPCYRPNARNASHAAIVAAKDKYAVNVNVVSAEGVARSRQDVVRVMVQVLLEAAVLMRLGNADLTPVKRVTAVEAAKRDTRYPAPNVLEMERSTYGKLVPLAVDAVLLPVDRKRPVLCVTARVEKSGMPPNRGNIGSQRGRPKEAARWRNPPEFHPPMPPIRERDGVFPLYGKEPDRGNAGSFRRVWAAVPAEIEKSRRRSGSPESRRIPGG